MRKTAGGDTWYDLGRGKAFDTSIPLGPCIVTADEIGDPQNLKLQTRINGELRQSSNTSDMIWTCAELVHFFSVSFTLKPGMVIITGTPRRYRMVDGRFPRRELAGPAGIDAGHPLLPAGRRHRK